MNPHLSSSKELFEAASFAAHKHQYQRRGGYPPLPYINHLLKVCYTLMEVGGVSDLDTLRAALLHDIIEDTDTTQQELADRFSPKVADLVQALSDDMDLPYNERKKLQLEGITRLSFPAQQIRIVDKGSNIEDISTYPLNWTRDRKLAYVNFAVEVVEPIRRQHPKLVNWFDEQVRVARVRIGSDDIGKIPL